MLFDRSNDNLVQRNRVSHTFDGMVVLDSSSNLISDNVFDPVSRFGLRLSGRSQANIIERNTFGGALLGAYVYGGASGNSLLDNRFLANREDLRIRADAPQNRRGGHRRSAPGRRWRRSSQRFARATTDRWSGFRCMPSRQPISRPRLTASGESSSAEAIPHSTSAAQQKKRRGI